MSPVITCAPVLRRATASHIHITIQCLVYQPSVRRLVVIGTIPLLCAYLQRLCWPLSAFWALLLPMTAQFPIARPWDLVLCTLTPSSKSILGPLQRLPSSLQTRMRLLGPLLPRSSKINYLEITILPCAKTLTPTRPLVSPMPSSAR